MIKIELLELQNKVNVEFKELKLFLKQKESIEYAAYKMSNPTDKSAKDKIIDTLKLADDEWLQKEEQLLDLESKQKVVAMIMETLQNTIAAMRMQSSIDKAYFDELQNGYLQYLEQIL